jgi:hypothetical protein
MQKELTKFNDFRDSLRLFDEDGYNFSFVTYGTDSHLIYSSDFAKESGLAFLDDLSMNPKIRKSCIALIELPDEFDTLFLTVQDGEISEV